uniref:Uncharacterized protein n=1 Tax=Sphaerodactylus townsendi TaxID=933632 RepID=A0ACB8FD40_9SAUR
MTSQRADSSAPPTGISELSVQIFNDLVNTFARLANSSTASGVAASFVTTAVAPAQPAREQEEEVSPQEEDEDEDTSSSAADEVREPSGSHGKKNRPAKAKKVDRSFNNWLLGFGKYMALIRAWHLATHHSNVLRTRLRVRDSAAISYDEEFHRNASSCSETRFLSKRDSGLTGLQDDMFSPNDDISDPDSGTTMPINEDDMGVVHMSPDDNVTEPTEPSLT